MRTKARHYYPPIKKCRGSTLKLLYLELSRSPNGFFEALLDPGGGFTEAKRLQIYNGYI
jgi:hypothetical protein